MVDYNEDSITTLGALDHMRLRLNSYIRDTAMAGQLHIIREAIDNGVDEIGLMDGRGSLEVMMFRSKDEGNYQVVVVDNGRGIPMGKMLDVLLKGNTSGKFNQGSYMISTGSNGQGIKTSLAASSAFRAITINGNKVGDTGTFNHTCLPKKLKRSTNKSNSCGTYLCMSPDPEVLHEIADFTNNYSLLLDHLSKISLFGNFRVRFYLFEEMITGKVMNSNTDTFLKFINSRTNYTPIFDSNTFDRELFVKNFFGVHQNFISSKHLQYEVTTDGYLSIDLKLHVLLTRNVNNNRLTFVNNILFIDKSCYQYTLLIEYIKRRLAPMIGDASIASYFKSNYVLPIWVYGDIKFSGAVFVGLDKSAYRDDNFKVPYSKALRKMFSKEYLVELYGLLGEHIEASYNNFSNKHLKVSGNKSLLTQLNFPTKFTDCRTSNREDAELFLVEGDSAKSDKARDPDFQASYALRGKPINGLTTQSNLTGSVEKIKNNQIFQDIIRILGIQNGSIDNLYFGKLLIATDADSHGYHIANIVLGNLFALCPRFVDSGKIYLTMPPHYRIALNKKKALFARTTEELNAILTKYIFHNFLEIGMESVHFNQSLTCEEYMAFNEIVSKIGDSISAIAEEHFIHPVILEQLALMTSVVDFSNPNVKVLSEAFGLPVRYDKGTKVLMVSIGTQDIIIPLVEIGEIIYNNILPLYRSFYYDKTNIFVTTKKSKLFTKQPVSIVQLYQLHQQLKSTLKISPLKGLGNMSPQEIYITCIKKETRRCMQVTSLGQVEDIFKMLGSDNTWRKELVLAGYQGVM